MTDQPSSRQSLGQRLAQSALESPAALPGLMAVAVFVGWSAYQGGFPPTVWYPGALLLLMALATMLAFVPRLSGVPRPALLAVCALAAFTAWCFASILWADVRGDAWDGANRTLLYLVAFSLFALWPWRPRLAAGLLGTYSAGVAAVMTLFVVRAASAGDPASYLSGGRLDEPTGYANANAALPLAALWPAVFLASRRETPWPVRGVMLGSAGLLVETGLLAQSRGSLFAFPIVLILYLALVPSRSRSVLVLCLLGAAAVAAGQTLLDVYPTGGDQELLAPALDRAAWAIGLSCGALAVAGALVGMADRRLELRPETSRLIGRAVAAAGAAACVAGIVALFAVWGHPFGRAADGWREFKQIRGYDSSGSDAGGYDSSGGDGGGSHFTEGLGSNRYDFWRVTLGELADHPLVGVGTDNFAVDYLRERRSPEQPLYPHSGVFRLLSQGGVVGALLFASFLVLALLAAHRARSRLEPFAGAAAAAAAVTFGYFFVHGAADWLWEFPGLGAPAFAALGLAAGLSRPVGAAEAAPGPRSAVRLLAIGGASLAALAAAASLALPWLAAREMDLATREWRANAAQAFARLDRARSLNPLSDRPDLVAGTIASRLGRWEEMRASFARAAERNAYGWYAYLELGLVEWLDRRREPALRALERAASLNPSETTITFAIERIREGQPVSLRLIDREFLQRVRELGS